MHQNMHQILHMFWGVASSLSEIPARSRCRSPNLRLCWEPLANLFVCEPHNARRLREFADWEAGWLNGFRGRHSTTSFGPNR